VRHVFSDARYIFHGVGRRSFGTFIPPLRRAQRATGVGLMERWAIRPQSGREPLGPPCLMGGSPGRPRYWTQLRPFAWRAKNRGCRGHLFSFFKGWARGAEVSPDTGGPRASGGGRWGDVSSRAPALGKSKPYGGRSRADIRRGRLIFFDQKAWIRRPTAEHCGRSKADAPHRYSRFQCPETNRNSAEEPYREWSAGDQDGPANLITGRKIGNE